MSGRHRSIVTALVAVLVASAFVAVPGAALSADATVDDPAPGAVGDYTVTLRPEAGDAVTENGLKSVTLDFDADRDYSGDLGDLTARDVEVRVGDSNGTVWAGRTTVNRSGEEVTITLEEAFRDVRPGDRIVVRVFGITNTEIALRNAQTLRGFALRASATGPDGNTDGPVEARYTIDPEATPQQTPTDDANGSNASDSGNEGDDTDSADNGTESSMNETMAATETAETTETTPMETTAVVDTMEPDDAANGSGDRSAGAGEAATNESAGNDSTENDSAMVTNGTISADGTAATGTAEPTSTATATATSTATETSTATSTPTATETTQPATTGGNEGGSGGQATETTGPGFGLLIALVALLAAGLLVARRND